MKRILTALFLLAFALSLVRADSPIGTWQLDQFGLPAFSYTGPYPFTANNEKGAKAPILDDPYFLLGNYYLTVFAHVSGKYQLLTGERAWGRMNQGDAKNEADS